MGEYEYEAEELEERWMDARPDYEAFCRDGILCDDGDGYRNGDYGVRILFLLKEAPYGVYDWYDDDSMIIRGQNVSSGSYGNSSSFWTVLGFRAYVIDCIANGNEPDWDDFMDIHDDEGYGLENAACVNIKKGNGVPRSDWGDLKAYAQDDRDFINEQIDLIDPDVIVCCGTYQVYQRCICDGDIPSGAQSQAVYDSVNDRYVIDMPHPAARKKPEALFHDMAGRCGAIGEWLRCRAEGLPYFRK